VKEEERREPKNEQEKKWFSCSLPFVSQPAIFAGLFCPAPQTEIERSILTNLLLY